MCAFFAVSTVGSAFSVKNPSVLVPVRQPQPLQRARRASDAPNGKHVDGSSSEIVARRIIVKGDVQGGYYRSCVLNEVRGLSVPTVIGSRLSLPECAILCF